MKEAWQYVGFYYIILIEVKNVKLIKNIQVYAPKNLGVKDVLISDSKIEKIDDHIDFPFSI